MVSQSEWRRHAVCSLIGSGGWISPSIPGEMDPNLSYREDLRNGGRELDRAGIDLRAEDGAASGLSGWMYR